MRDKAEGHAEELIKIHYVEEWHHPQKDMNFKLSDLDGQGPGPEYGNKDRDGKILLNGQIKSFRDYYGRVRKGKIYHNINNMWWVIVGSRKILNIASFAFFDDTISSKLLRLVPEVHVKVCRR